MGITSLKCRALKIRIGMAGWHFSVDVFLASVVHRNDQLKDWGYIGIMEQLWTWLLDRGSNWLRAHTYDYNIIKTGGKGGLAAFQGGKLDHWLVWESTGCMTAKYWYK